MGKRSGPKGQFCLIAAAGDRVTGDPVLGGGTSREAGYIQRFSGRKMVGGGVGVGSFKGWGISCGLDQ